MLVQFISMCSLILHVLLKDGESTNGGFTNNSKTAFKVDSPDENRFLLQSANALVVSQQYYKGRQLGLWVTYHRNDSSGCV